MKTILILLVALLTSCATTRTITTVTAPDGTVTVTETNATSVDPVATTAIAQGITTAAINHDK